ncbi:uncharacterized protein JN550_005943 [Neoarthrinium moseri]|uniref:uncharacterized protein n=1 Tax=Neoarthrinium moseri TaxID=1658444 RepID=UPI001FDAEEE9|nr:uncharacterized protein JN550_005943 [Neoarthrinium moseri]KAI1869313.1 hypothetical protein JN550_005943 [Neoarthrinium moseri]
MDQGFNFQTFSPSWKLQTPPAERHISNECDCPKCRQPRTTYMFHDDSTDDDRLAPEPMRTEHSAAHPQSRPVPSPSNSRGLSSGSSTMALPARSTSPTPASGLHPSPMTYPQIYVSPRSLPHLSFPVVDYSTKSWDSGTQWPHFYMALAPKCATLGDLRTALTPKGSGTRLTARSHADASPVEISTFHDLNELRCSIIQLEILDDINTTKPLDKSGKSDRRAEEGKEETVRFGLAHPHGYGYSGDSRRKVSHKKR